MLLLALIAGCSAPGPSVSPTEGGLPTDECLPGVQVDAAAPPLPFVSGPGPTTLTELAAGRPALVAFASPGCPECGRLRALVAGWQQRYPGLATAFVTASSTPTGPQGKPLVEIPFRSPDAAIAEWTESLAPPRVFVLDRAGVVRLRLDGFTARDAREVVFALERVAP